MEAEGDNNVVWFTYTGQEFIPEEATHIVVQGIAVIPAGAFEEHLYIEEVICHDRVEKIELCAFYKCPFLRRVIMPGVKIVETQAFFECEDLTEVECDKLEIIGECAFHFCISLESINLPSVRTAEAEAFNYCKSLKSIYLPSARIVGEHALWGCEVLTNAKFSNKLERIEESAFNRCTSLERITIPLKDGIIIDDGIFAQCDNFNHVDLLEGELHETIAALHLEDWRNDMNEEINSINRILPNARAGYYDFANLIGGEKGTAVLAWIRSVLRKIIHYQAEHKRLLDQAASTLQFALPQDITSNNVLPFLDLPPHTFELGDEEGELEDDSEGGINDENERESNNEEEWGEIDDDGEDFEMGDYVRV